MFLETGKRHQTVLGLTLGFTLILGVLIFIYPPSIYPDPSWGLQVMRCMEQGHGFNLLVSPDPTNIANNHSAFLSWWSPGQYLLPYFFKIVLWLNTGRAIALSIFICSVLGIWGYYKLFTRLGFSPIIAATSVAFIACQNYFVLPYIFYTGGETLLFAFGGWFLYACLGISKPNWQALVFILFAGLTGFFCKSSSLWIYAAGVACTWINISIGSKSIWQWLRNGILLAVPMVIALATIYFFYLSKGENPSGSEGGLAFTPETFTFPMASPFIAGFSLDEMVNGFIYHSDPPLLSYGWATIALITLALTSVLFVLGSFKYIANKNYALALSTFYTVGCVFFMYLYLKQAAVSLEGRHFRMIGLLAVPGVVYLVSKTPLSRVVFGLIWVTFLCWGLKTFGMDYKYNIHSARASSGISQQEYEQSVLTELVKLDNQHQNKAIFVITNPDIAIEIQHNRVITLTFNDMEIDDIKAARYAGNGGIIYMLLPASYVQNGMADMAVKSFVNYHRFELKQLSKNFYLYTAYN
jgi:hypothetical protein